jgi:hypothetical protein
MKTLSLYLFVLIALTSALFSQEIPNGDGDLLWERSLGGRFVNDAKFHPINGNIIAAVNHEIWEIDPKDGHTIRVFEGETGYNEFGSIDISSDGNLIILSNGGATNLKLYDYNSGALIKELSMKPWSTVDFFPNSSNILFHQARILYVYDVLNDKIVRESDYLSSTAAFMRTKLSKDGKYIAIVTAYETSGTEYSYHMELWDAETLTKIRDFGADNSIGEFNDVQISSNNQYVAFQGGGHFNFFHSNGEKISFNTFNWVTFFGFSYDGSKTIIEGYFNNQDSKSIVINNPIDQPLYSFSKFFNIIRFNSQNDIFSGRISMRFFSNKWYTVGVKPQFDTKTTISYENDQLILTLPNEVIPQKISILNLLGEIVYQTTELTELNDKIVLDLTLPSGIYLFSVNDVQSTFYGKFVVVR